MICGGLGKSWDRHEKPSPWTGTHECGRWATIRAKGDRPAGIVVGTLRKTITIEDTEVPEGDRDLQAAIRLQLSFQCGSDKQMRPGPATRAAL